MRNQIKKSMALFLAFLMVLLSIMTPLQVFANYTDITPNTLVSYSYVDIEESDARITPIVIKATTGGLAAAAKYIRGGTSVMTARTATTATFVRVVNGTSRSVTLDLRPDGLWRATTSAVGSVGNFFFRITGGLW